MRYRGGNMGPLVPCLLLAIIGRCAGLEIAAFNVQVFGRTKLGNTEVVDVLSQIVQRYDITLIQEIRDVTETAIHSFVEVVNNNSRSDNYTVEVSERLGSSTSKEQYAFIYRKDRVEVVDTLQHNDSLNDVFEREPFSVLFRSTGEAKLPPFFLMAIHVQPTNAFAEIGALLTPYEEAVLYFNNTNGVILGDLNADCTYLSQSQFALLPLVTDGRFTWLVTLDTTTAEGSHCAYDRIVVADDIMQYVVEDSGQVFLFDQEYGLTQEETLAVSDHYPVHFELQYSTPPPPPNLTMSECPAPGNETMSASPAGALPSLMALLITSLLTAVLVCGL